MELTLFHGSTQIVEHPLVIKGRDNLDFGKGFYLTSYREQAQQWALRLKVLRQANTVWVNKYTLDMDKVLQLDYRYLQMPSYDLEWLNSSLQVVMVHVPGAVMILLKEVWQMTKL